MVSIKYFCGVGELRRTKFNPAWDFTSRTGAVGAASNETKTMHAVFSNWNLSAIQGTAASRIPQQLERRKSISAPSEQYLFSSRESESRARENDYFTAHVFSACSFPARNFFANVL